MTDLEATRPHRRVLDGLRGCCSGGGSGGLRRRVGRGCHPGGRVLRGAHAGHDGLAVGGGRPRLALDQLEHEARHALGEVRQAAAGVRRGRLDAVESRGGGVDLGQEDLRDLAADAAALGTAGRVREHEAVTAPTQAGLVAGRAGGLHTADDGRHAADHRRPGRGRGGARHERGGRLLVRDGRESERLGKAQGFAGVADPTGLDPLGRRRNRSRVRLHDHDGAAVGLGGQDPTVGAVLSLSSRRAEADGNSERERDENAGQHGGE